MATMFEDEVVCKGTQKGDRQEREGKKEGREGHDDFHGQHNMTFWVIGSGGVVVVVVGEGVFVYFPYFLVFLFYTGFFLEGLF